MCNITAASTHSEETQSTLRFALRAKCVTNNATVNKVMSNSALIKRQQREIEELRLKLSQSTGGDHRNISGDDQIQALRHEMLEAGSVHRCGATSSTT